MRWNRPKAVVNKIMLISAILFLILSIVWLISAYIWINHPSEILKLDRHLPNVYQENLQNAYKKITKSKTKDQKYRAYVELLNDFPNMTSLHKGYHYIAESYAYITNYLQENGKSEQALQKAKQWQEKYPYEFSAKFNYYHILKTINPQKALKYMADLYHKFPDITNIINLHFDDLIANGQFNDALKVALKQKSNSLNNSEISFMFFYKNDKFKQFHSKTKIVLPQNASSHEGNDYTVFLHKNIAHFRGLRLDIDGMKSGSNITNVSFRYHLPNKTIKNIPFKPLHDLEKISDSIYKATGADPYFEITTPEEIKDSKEEINLTAKLSITNGIDFVINRILTNKEWQFFYSNEKFFNEKDSQKFSLKLDGNEFSAQLLLNNKNYKSIRLDFPAFINLNPKQLEIKINDNYVLNSIDISETHNFIKNKTIVNGLDPYIIFRFESPIQLNKITINFKLGEGNE